MDGDISLVYYTYFCSFSSGLVRFVNQGKKNLFLGTTQNTSVKL